MEPRVESIKLVNDNAEESEILKITRFQRVDNLNGAEWMEELPYFVDAHGKRWTKLAEGVYEDVSGGTGVWRSGV